MQRYDMTLNNLIFSVLVFYCVMLLLLFHSRSPAYAKKTIKVREIHFSPLLSAFHAFFAPYVVKVIRTGGRRELGRKLLIATIDNHR